MGGFWREIDPTIMVAIIGLGGVLVGHFTSIWGRKQDHDLAAISATVETLSSEVRRLQAEVDAMRKQMREAEGHVKLLTRKLRAAITWSLDLMATINGMIPLLMPGAVRPPIPNPPDILQDEL